MCYSGKSSIEFTEGINVIIGDNGYGKSKLYDAFYWVMYDEVFVPERKLFQKTEAVKSKIISDKAKANAKDGKFSTTVRIFFHDLEKDNFLILERKYTDAIIDGKWCDARGSEFTVIKKDLPYHAAEMVNDEDEKQKIVESILPPKLKDYLWFQGEQVESMIDFNKSETLTKAIDALSSIARYDDLKKIAVAVAKTGNDEFDRKVKQLSRDTGKSKQLEEEEEEFNKKIEGLLVDEIEIKENLSRAKVRTEELLSKRKDATKVSTFKQKKIGILDQLKELKENLNEEQINFHRKMFRSKWVMKGTQSLQDDFSKRFSIYQNKKLEAAAEVKAGLAVQDEIIRNLQTRLPLNVPEPIYVQRMLEEEKCLVCDREAKKNSDAWKKIKELTNRSVKNLNSAIEKNTKKQDFTDDFKRLYQTSLALTNRIEDIDFDINETLKRIHKISEKIREANKEIEKVDEDIQNLLSGDNQTVDDADNIIAEYWIQNKNVNDFTDKLNSLTQQLDHNRNKLKNVKDQMKELITGEIPRWLVEKKDILNDFKSIAESTRERVFNNLIEQLEVEANRHYEAMTSGNKAIKGQIKLRRLANGNYMPEIIDGDGIPLLALNTSNLILVKLSAIMAIISANSNDGIVSFYTLITDAPTSVFGEDYTIGFCKTISKVYRQSIIMSKEFYKNQNLLHVLLNNPEIKIGKVYSITPSIPESERGNRNNLSTHIKSLN